MRVLIVLCVWLLAAAAQAEPGIGASVNSGSETIYVPVTLSAKFMAEPYLSYQTEKQKTGTEVTSKATTIGVGLFRTRDFAENFTIYYGARLAYLKQEQSTTVTNFITGELAGINQIELDGYSIAPTLGFEYRVAGHLTVGAEIAAEHSDLDGKEATESPTGLALTTVNQSRIRTQTMTNIILRYFF
ncbi:MAG TPA: hypothetical protein VFY39_14160 [Gammaproteobacteria bacterium]|nr:hypothetical protein [Gammaproteobacteria bacterium]